MDTMLDKRGLGIYSPSTDQLFYEICASGGYKSCFQRLPFDNLNYDLYVSSGVCALRLAYSLTNIAQNNKWEDYRLAMYNIVYRYFVQKIDAGGLSGFIPKAIKTFPRMTIPTGMTKQDAIITMIVYPYIHEVGKDIQELLRMTLTKLVMFDGIMFPNNIFDTEIGMMMKEYALVVMKHKENLIQILEQTLEWVEEREVK